MSSKLHVDSDVAVPAPRQGVIKATLAALQPGDSFVTKGYRNGHGGGARPSSAVYTHAKAFGYAITSRVENTDPLRVRVWRVS